MWVLRLPFLSVSLFSFFLIFFLLFIFSSFVSLSLLFLVYFSLSIFYLYSFIPFPSHLFFSILPTNIYWTLLCQAWGTQVRSFSLCTWALLVPPASASSRHGVPAVPWGARRAETRSREGEEDSPAGRGRWYSIITLGMRQKRTVSAPESPFWHSFHLE